MQNELIRAKSEALLKNQQPAPQQQQEMERLTELLQQANQEIKV
jgi:hypothetical protein